MHRSNGKPIRRYSFQTKVLGTILAFLVLLPVITVSVVSRHLAEQARVDARDRLMTADAVFRNSIDIRTRNLTSRFRNIVNEPRFKAVAQLGDPGTMSDLFRELLEDAYEEAEIMYYADGEGELLAGVQRNLNRVPREFARSSVHLTEAALARGLQTGVIVQGSRVFNVVSVPVALDEATPPIGTLTLGVPFNDSVLEELKSLTRTEIIILADSRSIAGTLRDPDLDTMVTASGLVASSIAHDRKNAPVVIGDGHYHLLSGHLSAGDSPTILHYVLLSSYDAHLQALARTRAVLIGVSAAGILISAAIISFLIRRITRPLRALRAGAEAVGQGDFSARVETFSNDECGELAETFNRMTANLESSRSELEDTVKTLRTTQDQLMEREAGLRLIIENARDHAIFTLDSHGRVKRWNPAAQQLLGYSADEADGLAYTNFFSPEDRANGVPQRMLAATAEEGRRVFEGWRVRRDGSRFWADTTLSRLPGAENGGFVEISRDITMRKELEETLRSARDAAESANRAKSEFLANVSHEFRTPMNGILGMTSLLLDEPLTPQQREFAETIRSSADSLLTVIGNVLDISRLEAGRFELNAHAVDLNDLFGKVADSFASCAARKKIELGFVLAPDLPAMVVADNLRLQQALSSVIDNAIKFTHDGGVWVSAERACDLGPDQLRIVVEDTGIGIPADAQSRLFQPFSQVDGSPTRNFGGAGLGLAITRRLIRAMGGDISVDSTPGRGSRFTVTLRAATAVDGSSLSADLSPLQVTNALVVAPRVAARTIERQLQWWKLQATVASGHDALALRDRGFDVIVLDARAVPAVPSPFLSTLRKNCATPDTPVILVTDGEVPATFAGIDHVIVVSRPIRPVALRNALSQCRRVKVTDRVVAELSDEASAANPPLRTLVVDDNPINAKVALHLLRKLGLSADTAENGIEALELLAARTYDLVFMDLQMPVMDGVTAVRKLRETVPESQPPFVAALTANATQADRDTCMDAGMHAFLCKPARLNTIADIVEQASNWLTQRTTRDL